jgi:hypothetical protein
MITTPALLATHCNRVEEQAPEWLHSFTFPLYLAVRKIEGYSSSITQVKLPCFCAASCVLLLLANRNAFHGLLKRCCHFTDLKSDYYLL